MCWSVSMAQITLAHSESLTVALPNEGYAPYIIIEQEQVSGILVEPLQLAASNIGLDLHYVYYPEQRSKLMLENKQIDARMESEQWVDNPEDYLWSEAITVLEDVLVFNTHSELRFERKTDLIGGSIIAHLGYSYPTLQPLIEQNLLQRVDFASSYEMLSHLYRPLAGVNRAAVMNRYVAMWLIHSTPKFEGQFALSKQPIASAPLQFQFANNPRLAAIVSKLNQQLRQLKSANRIQQLTDTILKTAISP